MIEGNLLECTENIIVHQVNCQGVMGSGIAEQIKKKYPEVFKAYYYTCKTEELKDYFGTALICEANDGKYIANVFGQNTYGKGLHTDYEALKNGLKEVHDFAKEKGLSVALPYKIGCGRGGGDWNTVYDIITEIFFDDVPYEIYRLEV
jgi:O-acetyl-ADP-ribose deacetylase (regulator of RNase III)